MKLLSTNCSRLINRYGFGLRDLRYRSYKGHSRSTKSVLGKCIYFWKILETSLTILYIIIRDEVKDKKSRGSDFEQNSKFGCLCTDALDLSQNTNIFEIHYNAG